MESILADNPFVNPLGPSSFRSVLNICRTNVDFPPPTFKVKDFSYNGKVLPNISTIKKLKYTWPKKKESFQKYANFKGFSE